MNARPATLPDFDSPPVIEVVLGVQFERITELRTVHAGYLWDVFRNDFPHAQEHPPLNPTFETFGTKPSAGGVKFELMSGPLPFPRLPRREVENEKDPQFQLVRIFFASSSNEEPFGPKFEI